MSCPSESGYPTALSFVRLSGSCTRLSAFPATENRKPSLLESCCILSVSHMPLRSSSAHRVGAFAAQHALSLSHQPGNTSCRPIGRSQDGAHLHNMNGGASEAPPVHSPAPAILISTRTQIQLSKHEE